MVFKIPIKHFLAYFISLSSLLFSAAIFLFEYDLSPDSGPEYGIFTAYLVYFIPILIIMLSDIFKKSRKIAIVLSYGVFFVFVTLVAFLDTGGHPPFGVFAPFYLVFGLLAIAILTYFFYWLGSWLGAKEAAGKKLRLLRGFMTLIFTVILLYFLSSVYATLF
ncbi:hypothetical protein J4458_06670 [Candidatus Woesearchaeota archaeon]|nr:hypothetical protein [Candidatus Woesearchaeota archaeon]